MSAPASPWAAAAVVAALLLCNGCSSQAASRPDTASARVGDLRITGGYIPAESSPDVAAAYFTVRNTGSQADELLGASTPLAQQVMAHDEISGADGVDTMSALGTVEVPPGATVTFSVGHKHLMLMNPVHLLREGQIVPLALRFAHAGTVTLQMPVTADTGPSDATDMHDMPGMRGMNG
jgi:copper(I)-binding protein